jgi:thiol-disulfide isomerase/thioredoxin
MNKKKLAGYLAMAALFAVIGAMVSINRMAPEAPLTTTIAPTDGRPHTAVTELFAQTLNDVSGKAQPLSQWKGKPLLLNFWAPWCAPCVQEMPELSALAAKEGGKHFNVIGIGIDTASNIAQFAAKYKISYPLYVAGIEGTELSRQFGDEAGGLPYTVLIGADGQVRKTYLGRLKFDELKRDLAAL